jgi:protein gp37
MMPSRTKIEWADYISNPIKARVDGKQGHACVKISEGCQHCWASTFNVRLGTGLEYTVPNMQKAEMFLDEKEFKRMIDFKPRGPFKNGRSRPVVFPCDMTDLFGDWVPDAWIDNLYAIFSRREDVDWFVLTKRPQRMMDHWLAWAALPNVFLGTSIENDKRAVERYEPMSHLSAYGWNTWVSYEPALGIVEWNKWDFLTVLMCGGESGNQARWMHPDWARSTRDFCVAKGIKYFFKQWGEWAPIDQLMWVTSDTTFKHKPVEIGNMQFVHVGKGLAGHCLDGREWMEMPK